MATEQSEAERVQFESYEYQGTGIDDKVNALIEAGRLPFDAFFRLESIGRGLPDLLDEDEFPCSLKWNILQDMIVHAGNPTAMRADTQRLLWGEPPNAVVDPCSNNAFYTSLEPMYYELADLASAIERRRQDEGETATDVPQYWRESLKEFEWSRCLALARPLWRVMVNRIHPEWLRNPGDYYHATISFDQIYGASERTMRRRLVGWTVLSDTVVFDIYKEALEVGVKGIAKSGKRSLRYLLADEHPELY